MPNVIPGDRSVNITVTNQSAIVQIKNQPTQTVKAGQQGLVAVNNTSAADVAVINRPTQIVEAGQQGPPGRSGIFKIPFSWGDATPSIVTALPAGTTVFTAQIVIQVPFNGIGAALQLGDADVSDRLIQNHQVDPTFVAEYETNPGYTYTITTQILLTITPGEGCTQGKGYVLLEAA